MPEKSPILEPAMPHSPEQNAEILLLLNANTDLWQILDLIEAEPKASYLILTTHFLHEHETDFLLSRSRANLIFSFMAEWFQDSEAAMIDEASVALAIEVVQGKTVHTNFTTLLAEKMLFERNKSVFEKISAKGFRFRKIYFQADAPTPLNLGISVEFWQKQMAIPLKNLKMDYEKHTKPGSRKIPFSSDTLNLLKPLKVLVFESDEAIYLFLAPPKRLKWASGTATRTASLPLAKHWAILLKKPKKAAIYQKTFEALKADFTAKTTKPIRVGVNMHGFSPILYEALKEHLYIFSDAFRSSNYFVQMAHYVPYGTVVVRDMFDANFFQKHQIPTIKAPQFIQKATMHTEKNRAAKSVVDTVVLLLQHAGDWSAMINRSDTDLLLLCFMKLAAFFPTKQFIIRLHPTMQHELHEGAEAIFRVLELLESSGLQNVKVSKLSLEEDLERGDYFISEYSLTLIDAWQRQKIGMAVNLTRRRSFMTDYEQLGFLYAHSIDECLGLSAQIVSRPDIFLHLQQQAMDNYNALYTAFMEV